MFFKIVPRKRNITKSCHTARHSHAYLDNYFSLELGGINLRNACALFLMFDLIFMTTTSLFLP